MDFRELFDSYNSKYFNGVVQAAIRIYSRKGNRHGFYRYAYGERSININMVTGTEQDKKQTLLHEMIHAFLHQTGYACGHTPIFKRMMKDLTEKEFGFRPTGNVRFHFSAPSSFVSPAPHIFNVHVPSAPVFASVATKSRYFHGDAFQGGIIKAIETKDGRQVNFKIEINGKNHWVKNI